MSILNPKVVVAIPTLNAGPTLAACLAALGRQTFADFETIVIDNGGRVTHQERPGLRVLRPGRNLGYGAAINLAVRESRASWVATLNDDAVADTGWLQGMISAAERAAAPVMVASRVMLDEARLDSMGLLLCGDGTTKQHGHGAPPDAATEPRAALIPSGSAALYPRELFDRWGGFDESLFLYCEDSDLGLRARWLGIGCVYAPSAVVTHAYSATAGRASALKAYLVERNRIALAIKCLPFSLLWKAPFVAVARYWWHLASPTGAAAEFRTDAGALQMAWLAIKAHLATVAALPRLLAQRGELKKTRHISSREFCALVSEFRISTREVAAQ